MEETFSFRLLCGKGSRSGHIRKEEKQTEIFCRGLEPGLLCTLYRDGKAVDTSHASAQGTLSFTCPGDGFFFLCHEDVLLLWEEEKDKNQNYFRARSLMPKRPKAMDPPSRPESPRAVPSPAEASVSNDPPEKKKPILQPIGEETAANRSIVLSPLPETPPVTSPVFAPFSAETLPTAEPVLSPIDDAPPLAEEPLLLRIPSDAPSVQTLPCLYWPTAARHLQSAFHSGTPFMPFSAPGFRCIRLPSPNPALPYCILGYQAKGSRVCSLLYAVPGHPLVPPRGFRADQYRDGHFIRIHPLPAEHKSS